MASIGNKANINFFPLKDTHLFLLRAHHHHQFRQELRRVYPPPLGSQAAAAATPSFAADERVPKADRIMFEWFRGMCMLNEDFCY